MRRDHAGQWAGLEWAHPQLPAMKNLSWLRSRGKPRCRAAQAHLLQEVPCPFPEDGRDLSPDLTDHQGAQRLLGHVKVGAGKRRTECAAPVPHVA